MRAALRGHSFELGTHAVSNMEADLLGVRHHWTEDDMVFHCREIYARLALSSVNEVSAIFRTRGSALPRK